MNEVGTHLLKNIKSYAYDDQTIKAIALANTAGCLTYIGYKMYRSYYKPRYIDAKKVSKYKEKYTQKLKKKQRYTQNKRALLWLGIAGQTAISGYNFALTSQRSLDFYSTNIHFSALKLGASLIVPPLITYLIKKEITSYAKRLPRKENHLTKLVTPQSITIDHTNPDLLDNKQNDNDTTCSICLESLSTNDLGLNNNCDHIFHYSCIKNWTENKNSCPLCRGPLASITQLEADSSLTSQPNNNTQIQQLVKISDIKKEIPKPTTSFDFDKEEVQVMASIFFIIGCDVAQRLHMHLHTWANQKK